MAAAHIPAHFSWLCEHACETGLLLPASAVANVTQCRHSAVETRTGQGRRRWQVYLQTGRVGPEPGEFVLWRALCGSP
jgi:hypothetical protein